MDHFLFFPVTASPAAADGDSRDHFLVFPVTARPSIVDGDGLDHLLVFSITKGSAVADIVIPWTSFWSCQSPSLQYII